MSLDIVQMLPDVHKARDGLLVAIVTHGNREVENIRNEVRRGSCVGRKRELELLKATT